MSYRYRENSPGRRRRSRSPIAGGGSYNGGRSGGNGYEIQRNGGGYGDRNGNGYADRSNGYDRERNNGYYDRERGDRYGGASRRRSRSRDRYGGGGGSDEDDMCRLHVGDLNERVTQDDLERAFSRYGEIKEVWMARNPPSFAFIVFRDARDAAAALRDMDAR